MWLYALRARVEGVILVGIQCNDVRGAEEE